MWVNWAALSSAARVDSPHGCMTLRQNHHIGDTLLQRIGVALILTICGAVFEDERTQHAGVSAKRSA
jgi:hypothetical protein